LTAAIPKNCFRRPSARAHPPKRKGRTELPAPRAVRPEAGSEDVYSASSRRIRTKEFGYYLCRY
jgi:hypothetical protein